MRMSPREQAAHDLIRKTLLEEGHKTYAEYFMLFELHLFDNRDMGGTDENPVIAFMVPDKGVIYLNQDINDLDTVTLLMRHEMLHEYLKHGPRFKQYMRNKQGLSDDEEPEIDPEIQQLSNVAADYELSKFYAPDRDYMHAKAIRLGDKFLEGLVLELDHPEWMQLTYEELLDKVIENKEQIMQQIGQRGLGEGSKQGQRATELKRQAQELRREAQRLRKEAQEQQEGQGGQSGENGESGEPGSSEQGDKEKAGQEGESGLGTGGGSNKPTSNSSSNNPSDQKGSSKANMTPEELEERAKQLEEKAQRVIDGIEDLEDEIDDRDPAFSESDGEKEAREKRLQQIKSFFDDLEREREFLDETEERRLEDEREREKRRKAIGDKHYKSNLRKEIPNLKTMSDFRLDLNRTVAKQIGKEGKWQDTYTKVNRRFSGTGILRPGQVQNTPKKIVPKFFVYYDISGSFTDPMKYKAAADAIHTIQEKYEKKGKIKVTVFYHESGAQVYSDRKETQQVGENLVEHVSATRPDNVIIITDSDPESTCNVEYIARVKGVVFMLFPKQQTSPVLAAHIVGSKNYYYDLYETGISKMTDTD